MKVTFSPSDSLSDILDKIEQYRTANNVRGKLRFTFSAEVSLLLPNGKTIKGKVFDLKIFKSSTGEYAYTNRSNGRWGRYITGLPAAQLVSIETISQDKDWAEESKRMLRKFHPNVWSDLREKLNDGTGEYLRDHLYGNLTSVSITQKFPQYVLDQLVEAFNNKKAYSYRMSGEKRDLSVETAIGEDGVFRAWFSSEYAGCGNGDYWLLANPTTAILRETD